ncbi:DUF2500 domain-containing protein [Erwinia tracheiphila]|uniref:DUF2500 domain-containing protein n=1 Tax=Erwinia tracheiphila TaxID=65700 RepID=UPI00033D49EC|nr:DUF2500 domain-containing protein [Erwinia tracheiphila]EOS93659.1 hypothetical protein ETR_17911 [Erwinia tracheiphila PSU-1]UIA87798.1 DUF2500 domain-containing protein [Erwinia tracheiphila]UIA96162.1 DUF2500 domain-containing protein [Erwinia tracheiphila]
MFLTLLAVIAVLATRQLIKQRREIAVNDVSPTRSLLVEVKARREKLISSRRSCQRETVPVEEMRYEAWFHSLTGAGDFKLVLMQRDYQQTDEGAKGKLKLKGTRFISFSPMAQ